MVKVHVLGRMAAGENIDADHRDTIMIRIDREDGDQRKAVLDATSSRLTWLPFVADDQMRVFWIGKFLYCPRRSK